MARQEKYPLIQLFPYHYTNCGELTVAVLDLAFAGAGGTTGLSAAGSDFAENPSEKLLLQFRQTTVDACSSILIEV